MTDWDPNSFGDRRPEADEPLEMPLEMFFAEDRGDPEALAAGDALASDVLNRVAAERGFVSTRERRLIRFGRSALALSALCVLLAAAVLDRLGAAPWSPEPAEGPVSDLVISASQGTAGNLERALQIREGLLRVVVQQDQDPQTHRLTLVVESDGQDPARAGAQAVLVRGPYLSAGGVDHIEPCAHRTIIRFGDGFSMPVMTGESPVELRWPASREITATLVPLAGQNATNEPCGLSPSWYVKRASDGSR